MAKRAINNVKLGIFVIAGLVFLVLLLYMIGRNRNMFGSNYQLKARFENVQGVVPGNNVRFAGIQAGTVKKVKIISDTMIEITMVIDTKMKSIIRNNSVVSIGTDGLVGNRVVNITPDKRSAPLAVDGDILPVKKALNTDEMIQTLNRTNNDVAVIAAELKETVQRVNNSNALWSLLNDNMIPENIRASVQHIRNATQKADHMAADLSAIITGIKGGKGSVGALVTDSSFAINLKEAVTKIQSVSDKADSLALSLNSLVNGIRQDIDHGNGALHSLLKDSSLVKQLNASLENIRNGTDGFNQNMEALKHNFLLRGYFKKLEKQKNRAAGQ
jgi:phospholipid/cholesterol/gamma-HCH transport system substrate-binding protein